MHPEQLKEWPAWLWYTDITREDILGKREAKHMRLF